jgi:DNA modification methylase
VTSFLLDPHEIVIPPDRFRPVDPKAAEARALSMMKFGQLQSILVRLLPDGRYELVAGYHRTVGCQLNATSVRAELASEADPILLREMELEENISRLDMHWTERERAVAEIHRLRTARDPNWTQAQTQQVANVPRQADVSESLQLVKMMELFPEIKEAKSKHQALSWAKAKADLVMRVHEVRNDTTVDYSDIESRVTLGDSVEVIKTIPDNSFHAVITDPPFGIDYDSRKAGTESSLSTYQDDEENYRRLLTMAPDLYRVVKPNGWLVWFFGMSWYEECKKVFRGAGFKVDEIPIIWNRSDGRCHTNRPDRYFSRGYDVALHCFKGEPQIIQRGKSNVLTIPPIPTGDRELTVERPVELYEELINRLTVPGEHVADFFPGSGSCLAACAKTGRRYYGNELDPERRAVAIKKIKAYTPDRTNAA